MILRRIRGVLSTAVIWGVSWAALGTLLILMLRGLGHADPEAPAVRDLALYGLAVFGTVGSLAGAIFALLVVMLGRSPIKSRFSPGVAALIGAMASAISTRAFFDQPLVVAVLGLFGGLVAAASVWVAQPARPVTVSDREAAT